MKKKFVIAGLVLGMAVAVSACGGKSEKKESTTAAASQEEGTKAAESKAGASSEKAEGDIKPETSRKVPPLPLPREPAEMYWSALPEHRAILMR